MFELSWLPAAVLYPITSLSDGCLLLAAALATTLGGRPLIWGISFAAAHFVYALLGAFTISQLNTSSELAGDILILLGCVVLLSQTLHHQIRHSPGGDCGCSHHPHSPSVKTILSTSFGLSLHSLAGGAIARQLSGDDSLVSVIIMISITALLIGGLVGLLVQVGEWERRPLTNFFDKFPGIVSGALVVVAGWCGFHILEHLVEASALLRYGYFLVITVLSLGTAYYVHDKIMSREQPTSLVKLSSRKA